MLKYKIQIVLAAVMFVLGAATGPVLAGTYTWQDASGVLQMSNIGTLVPAEQRIQPPPIQPRPQIREQAPPPGPKPPVGIDSEIERVQTAIAQIQDRNQKVLELKQWLFKLLEDPKQFSDPSFVEWLRRIVESYAPSPLEPP